MTAYRYRGLVLALFAFGLLGAGSVVRAQGYGGPHGGGEGMYGFAGMERLHDALKLNPQQEALWKKAQETSREAFKKMRASAQEMREKIRAEIDKPGADLKNLQSVEDKLHEQMDATRKQVRAARLAVYESLDAGQKEQVRLAIKERMDHGGRMGMHGRRGPQDRGPAQRKESSDAGKS